MFVEYEGEETVAHVAPLSPRSEVRRAWMVVAAQQHAFEAATPTVEGPHVAPGTPIRADGGDFFRAAGRFVEELVELGHERVL